MQEYADFLFTQSAHSPPFCPARTTGGTRPLHGISIVYKLGAGTERVCFGYAFEQDLPKNNPTDGYRNCIHAYQFCICMYLFSVFYLYW